MTMPVHYTPQPLGTDLDRGVPLECINNGHVFAGRRDKYVRRATTGQMGPPVLPITIVTPLPETSVLTSKSQLDVGWVGNGCQ